MSGWLGNEPATIDTVGDVADASPRQSPNLQRNFLETLRWDSDRGMGLVENEAPGKHTPAELAALFFRSETVLDVNVAEL